MELYRIIIAPRAARDLDQILDHIAKDSPANGESVANRISHGIELLGEVPHRAEVREVAGGGGDPVRSLAVRPSIVFFRTIDDQKVVRVLRIRHGARRRLKRYG
jgi:plasmid stabilization system protein ParE